MTTRSRPHKPNLHILVEFRAHCSKYDVVVTMLPQTSVFGVSNIVSLMSIALCGVLEIRPHKVAHINQIHILVEFRGSLLQI